MTQAYHQVFQRLGVEYAVADADSGNIGGSMSHEFHIMADVGEDEVLCCKTCGYAANVEKAEGRMEHVHVKNISVESPPPEVSVHYLIAPDTTPSQVIVITPADRDPNVFALKPHLNGTEYRLCNNDEREEVRKMLSRPAVPPIYVDDAVECQDITLGSNSCNATVKHAPNLRSTKHGDGCPKVMSLPLPY